MKAIISLALCISSLILLPSCSSSADHGKEIAYYAILNKIRVTTEKPLGDCFQALNSGYFALFTKKPSVKIDSNYVNYIKKTYSKAIQALDSAIYKLNAIEELDPEINLKAKMLTYYKDSKTFLESAAPKSIDMLIIKNGELTNEERQIYINLSNEGKEINEKETGFDDLFVAFREKHHVTGEELREYGLSNH